jgi:hypothetical protein
MFSSEAPFLVVPRLLHLLGGLYCAIAYRATRTPTITALSRSIQPTHGK